MDLNSDATRDIRLVFSVPLLVQRVPGAERVNTSLREAILERERESPGRQKSNSGGWHSEETLLTWPIPEIATLRSWMESAVERMNRLPLNPEDQLDLEYRATGWANVNRNGDYNTIHIHAGSHWAVVYYVATGVEAPGHSRNGQLEIRDPRPAAGFGRVPGFMFGRAITITPQAGMLIVFPAWLEHWVHPFYGTGERISIAVNIDILRRRVLRQGQQQGEVFVAPNAAPAPV